MPIVRKAAAICDRCGAKQEFDASEAHPLGSFSGDTVRSKALEGWRDMRDGKCLCPDCAALYAGIVERHERELREFMGVKTVEFAI